MVEWLLLDRARTGKRRSSAQLKAHELVTSLGATVLRPASGVDPMDDFQVYADPAGHPFCLCWVTHSRDEPHDAS